MCIEELESVFNECAPGSVSSSSAAAHKPVKDEEFMPSPSRPAQLQLLPGHQPAVPRLDLSEPVDAPIQLETAINDLAEVIKEHNIQEEPAPKPDEVIAEKKPAKKRTRKSTSNATSSSVAKKKAPSRKSMSDYGSITVDRPRRQSARAAAENLQCLYTVTDHWMNQNTDILGSETVEMDKKSRNKRRVTFPLSQEQQDIWECQKCTLHNPTTAEKCLACGAINVEHQSQPRTKKPRTSTDATEIKSAMKKKRIVITSTSLNSNLKVNCIAYAKALAETPSFTSKFEIRWTDEFDADVTHLLADVDENGFCHRTTKYLLALLHGCWIVRSDCMCSTPQ